MSKIKKALAVLLAAVMTLAMCVPTFAANEDGVIGTSDDRGTITVNGVDAEDGVTVTAYPIAMAEYDTNGNFSGYSNPYSIADLANPTAAEIAAIAAGTLPEGSFSLDKQADGSYKKDDVAVGMYMILVKGSETTVYNPAVASIYYDVNGALTENTVTNGSLNLASTSNIWVKKSGQPDIDKTIVGGAQNDGSSVNIGDTVNYSVTVNPIPNYTGTHPVLNVVDTLDAGLTLDKDSVKVQIDGADLAINLYDKDTTVDQKLKIDFVVNGAYTLNDYAGKAVVITYSAKVNENATKNEIANTNDAELTFTKDSTTTSGETTENDKTYTYTFEIDGNIGGNNVTTEDIIKKTGKTSSSSTSETNALAGAEFTLYTDEACATVYTNKKADGTVLFDGKAISTATGQIRMSGLAAGTYYLKETKAPEGYTINTHVFKVEIEAVYDTTVGAETEGMLTSWSVKIDNANVATFTLTNTKTETTITTVVDSNITGIDIANTKLTALPSTGGIGTTIFTIGGILIMLAAAGLFFVSRRRTSK